MKANKWQRKLCSGIDAMVGEMGSRYGTPSGELSEEAEIDRRMGDIQLRDDVIALDEEVLRCKKLSERLMDEERMDVKYEIRTEVSSKGIVTRVSVGEAARAA
jgi:hypothetical protein